MSQQETPGASPWPISDRCSACPFIRSPLRQLRDADYWHCIECHYRDLRFNELLDAELIRAFRICIRCGELPEHDAEDVSQDYCFKIMYKRPSWNGSPPKPWFNTLLSREIANWYRRRKREKRTFVDFHVPIEGDPKGVPEPTATDSASIDPLISLILKEEMWRIEACLELIKSDRMRRVLTMVFEGFTNSEINAVLNIDENAIRNDKNRGLAKIKECLSSDQFQ